MQVLFVLSELHPTSGRFLDRAFDQLAGMTATKRPTDEDLRRQLEGTFRIIEPRLDHLSSHGSVCPTSAGV